MSDISTSYVEPGVYVQYQDAQVPAAPASVLIPVIIGEGKRTISISETVTRAGTGNLDTLAHSPLFSISSITDRPGTVYTSGTDFTVTMSSGVINWIGTAPAALSDYQVEYTYEKGAADYAPYTTTRMEDIVALFGPAQYTSNIATSTVSTTATVGLFTVWTSATYTLNQYAGNYIRITSGSGKGQERLIVSNVLNSATLTVYPAWSVQLDNTSVYEINDISTNTLAIGAQLAISQGASYIMCVQLQDNISSATTGWQAAMDALELQECYCVVPMRGLDTTSTPESTILNYLKTHVTDMSTMVERKFRMALIGVPIGTTTTAAFISIATLCDSERMAVLTPDTMDLTLNGVTETVDGSYLAASVAGIICNPNYTWGEPISGKSVIPFDDIVDPFTRTEKNMMAGNGVMIIEKKGPGDFRIRHALTTNPSTVAEQELKVTRIKDGLSKYMISSLESAFINTRNVGNETISNIKAFMKFLLSNVISRQDITEFSDPDVRVSPSDPRQINISFNVRPSYDVNYIKITFGVSL